MAEQNKFPTEAQIKEFWKWCGLKYEIDEDEYKVILPDGDWYNFGHNADISPDNWKDIEPEIDLNNLFKYAVPRITGWRVVVYETGRGYASYVDSKSKCGMWEVTLSTGDTPALALFWALYQVKEASK